MVCFPNAKINIGLNITSKRLDGFHDIETVFYPIQLSDVLEFIPTDEEKTVIKTSGIGLNISDKENICYKAYKLLSNDYQLPQIEILLHKIIPSGAGLGGGSADAAFLLKELNSYFQLGITDPKLEELAVKLGSDCAFFINNKTVFAHGRGEKFHDITLNLSDYYIYLVKPEVFVSTAEAYSGVKLAVPENSLLELIDKPLDKWENSIFNDFEPTVFKKFPLLREIKDTLYNQGAIYAAMSGSGSSIYGIFSAEPTENPEFDNFFTWISKL